LPARRYAAERAAYTGQQAQRMARLLSQECARKVYVYVYAEGPTRILCFAEEKLNLLSAANDENSVVNLATR
jgi:hypothetical protein